MYPLICHLAFLGYENTDVRWLAAAGQDQAAVFTGLDREPHTAAPGASQVPAGYDQLAEVYDAGYGLAAAAHPRRYLNDRPGHSAAVPRVVPWVSAPYSLRIVLYASSIGLIALLNMSWAAALSLSSSFPAGSTMPW